MTVQKARVKSCNRVVTVDVEKGSAINKQS